MGQAAQGKPWGNSRNPHKMELRGIRAKGKSKRVKNVNAKNMEAPTTDKPWRTRRDPTKMETAETGKEKRTNVKKGKTKKNGAIQTEQSAEQTSKSTHNGNLGTSGKTKPKKRKKWGNPHATSHRGKTNRYRKNCLPAPIFCR